MNYVKIFLTLMLGFFLIASPSSAENEVISAGSRVALDYTLTVDGEIVDSSDPSSPLEYTQGDGSLIPALSKALEGLKAGDEKTIELRSDEAYGPVDPNAFQTIPLSALPADKKPVVGMYLQGNDKNGQVISAKIIEITADSIKVDLNHPLAGKTLLFKVKIVSVK